MLHTEKCLDRLHLTVIRTVRHSVTFRRQPKRSHPPSILFFLQGHTPVQLITTLDRRQHQMVRVRELIAMSEYPHPPDILFLLATYLSITLTLATASSLPLPYHQHAHGDT